MRKIMTWMILTSIVTAQPAVFAEKYSQNTPQLTNVELNEKNELVGKLVDVAGTPIAGTKITIRDQKDPNKAARVVVSDENGAFVLSGLRNGKVLFDIENESFGCRVWQHGTAPPKALTSVSVVPQSHATLVRGQGGPFQRLRALTPTQKVLLGVLVAAAIIIPIALDDDDDAS